MKDFKEAATTGQPYVVVRNNQVELRRTDLTGPVHLFGHGAVAAVMSGDTIVVTFKDGRISEYRVNPGNTSVSLIKNL
jgi:hypothetical protein